MTTSQHWILEPSQELNATAMAAAQARQSQLTKPTGSLGMLEQLAITFAGWQGVEQATLNTILVRVFAADHGVCAQGVSAFPQEVTAQMIMNFVNGGAAISVLAKSMGADFQVINLGAATVIADAAKLINSPIAAATQDFTKHAAMSSAQLQQALGAGQMHVSDPNAQLFIGGDMGIANTTSASAIYSAVLGLTSEQTVGPGTGVDAQGIQAKQDVINRALDLHSDALNDPQEILRCVGGFEIAGLVGSYIAAAQAGIPILVDGFISTAAALLAVEINPSVREWMIFAHKSAEPAHCHALEYLHATPLLDLDMRLGEGSGAAVAVSLIRSALELHSGMATFAQAGVTDA
jgi:nicotinate-nucleotide--dimethylbenzimidazole phosphoribosyltransferase